MSTIAEALRRTAKHQSPLILTASASFALGIFLHSLAARNQRPEVQLSPLTQLSALSLSERDALPYPPDVLPNARDVATPYGTIRVNEWGPEIGRKVLLVHGVSTPSVALGGIAHGLADKGCRVMSFDLFGRGYSDNPGDLPQDKRLFATQILLALASSPLSWTGKDSGGFALIGFSLGGGIVAAFTSFFPNLVNSLILLAPAGLIRRRRIGATSKILYSTGILPEWLLRYMVSNRLNNGPSAARGSRVDKKVLAPSSAAEKPITMELPKNSFDAAKLSKSHPDVTVAGAVAWQVAEHPGFVRAFMSSIRYAPVVNQYEDWCRIGKRLSAAQKVSSTEESAVLVGKEKLDGAEGLKEGNVLLIAGDTDDGILKDEIFEDADRAFEGHVVKKSVNAGHEFPITKAEEVVDIIWDFWNGSGSGSETPP